MVTIDPSLWNTLFGWMGPKTCLLPDGCIVPWQGVLVYVALLLFLGTLVYWFRHDIRDMVIRIVERIKGLMP